LVEYADELDVWLAGRRPLPPAGPPAGLRMALQACAIVFRSTAHGVDARKTLVSVAVVPRDAAGGPLGGP
jgi:hypothetical protein